MCAYVCLSVRRYVYVSVWVGVCVTRVYFRKFWSGVNWEEVPPYNRDAHTAVKPFFYRPTTSTMILLN